MMKAFTGKIQGRVQGVGYRYFAERTARENGIRGWIRNQPDGTVEVTASGSETDLEKFLQELKRGPQSCRVESIDVDWLQEAPYFKDFSITG